MSTSTARTDIVVTGLSIIILSLMVACESAPTTTQQPSSPNPGPAKDTGYDEITWSTTALFYTSEAVCATWTYGVCTTKVDTNKRSLTFSTSIPDSLPAGRIWHRRGLHGIDTIHAWRSVYQSERADTNVDLHIEIDTTRQLFTTIRFSSRNRYTSPSAPLYSSEFSRNETALIVLRNVPYSIDTTGSLLMAIDSAVQHLYFDSLDIRGESYTRHEYTNSTTCTSRSLEMLPGIPTTSIQLTLRRR